MTRPININHVPDKFISEQMDIFSTDHESRPFEEYNEAVFTEAVFSKGKAALKPIEDQFQVIKDVLDKSLNGGEKITGKDGKKYVFSPMKFIRGDEFKKLEDVIKEVFGFRNVEVENWVEKYKYGSKDKDFESMCMNCYTYTTWRYPIDGLLSDKGFYDKTHSINTTIRFSMAMIHKLTAAELTAVFLHELGHNIDPALVMISYTETNALVKYMTDREKNTNANEKKIEKEAGGKFNLLLRLLGRGKGQSASSVTQHIVNPFSNIFFKKDKATARVKDALLKNEKEFSRQANQEAYADNFARMYGYAAALTSAFSKMQSYRNLKLESRIKKEKKRQQIITDMFINSIKDVHGTNAQRIAVLIKEYEADLADKNIPEKVKVGIRKDLEELKKVTSEFLKSSDSFTNNMNSMIIDEFLNNDKSNIDESKISKSGGKVALVKD